jgi:hypothetical protein
MSWWQWSLTLGAVAVLVFEIAELLSPFRLDESERPGDAGRRRLVGAWFAGWRRRPRESWPLGHWVGRVLASFVVLKQIGKGASILLGSHATSLIGGPLALLVSVPLLLIIIGYAKRPVGELTSPTRSSASQDRPRSASE